ETEVYLEDRQEETFTLLNLADYQLIVNSKLSGTGRFFLHIVNSTLTYGGEGLHELQIVTSNVSQILYIKGTLKPDTIITIYDTHGRQLVNKQLDVKNKNNKLDISNLSEGMYIVKIRSGAMEKIKKIFVN